MINKFRNLLISVLMSVCAFHATAAPILAADGSSLTGVNVGGITYDVMFGDGIVGQVFPAAEVATPEWQTLALSVSMAVGSALVELTGSFTNATINGCEDFSGPVPICGLFLPDAVQDANTLVSNYTLAIVGGVPAVQLLPQVFVELNLDTTTQPQLTLLTFARASEPMPVTGSLPLLMLGLLFVLLHRSRCGV